MNIEPKLNSADASALPAISDMHRRDPAHLLVARHQRMRNRIRLALGLFLGVALVALLFE